MQKFLIWGLILLVSLPCLAAYDATIQQAQKKLISLGYDPGSADGYMGNKTRKALLSFQIDRNLPVTGKVDTATQDALGIGSRGIKVSGTSVRDQGRVALVIGNNTYQTAPLNNPVNDANDMASVLQGLHFEVIKKTNATQRTMEEAISTFGEKLYSAEIGLFFYAGHGMQIDGVNYLIPIDAKCESAADVRYEAVHAERVLAQMQQAKNKLNIVILDACRNNPFRTFRSSKSGLAQMHAPKGSIVVYATAPGSVAADGSGRNGLFTSYLLRNFKQDGLTVQQVFQQTGLSVMSASSDKQVPWVSSTPIPDYYLAAKVPTSTSATAISTTTQPELPPATTGLSDMDEVIRQREAAQEKWGQWQSRMVNDYSKAERYEKSNSLSPMEKASVWQTFSSAWSADNPYSTEDEKMRANASARLQYWKTQKTKVSSTSSTSTTVAMSSKPRCVEKDGQYCKLSNGMILDTSTNLMWAPKDNGADINWRDAKRYCENYTGGGYRDWRMPTQDELAGLYDKSKSQNCSGGTCEITPLIDITGWKGWASETSGSEAVNIRFAGGGRVFNRQSGSPGYRAFPVRSSK